MAINANRSQLIWTPILGWALLTCAASDVQAQAETATPAEQTLEQQTPVVDLPVHDLFSPGGTGRPDNELGIALGAYQLYPSIEILGGYDNNVFATSAPTTGSLFTVIKPQLELKSEWLNHSISVLASGGFGFYASAPTQNYQNYLLLASGKLEIREDLYVTGKIGAQRATEALGTPNTSFATAPTVVDTIPIEFSLYQRFNRFFYQLTVAATRYWYYDNSVISGDALPGTSRDYTGAEERMRFGYEISDDASIFIEPGLNQRIYTQFINVAGQQRDSRGWFVNFGGSKAFSAKSKLEGFIGYQSLSYIADGTTTGATTFGLTGGDVPLFVENSSASMLSF